MVGSGRPLRREEADIENLALVRREGFEIGRRETSSRTTAISVHAVHGLVLAHLIEAPLAGFAGAIVTAMPGPANSVSNLVQVHSWTNSDNLSDRFVARDNRKGTTHHARLLVIRSIVAANRRCGSGSTHDDTVAMAYATGLNLD